jgi:hypothetical protein
MCLQEPNLHSRKLVVVPWEWHLLAVHLGMHSVVGFWSDCGAALLLLVGSVVELVAIQDPNLQEKELLLPNRR